MTELNQFDRDLRQLEADLKKLEAEYTMYFAGHSPRPPIESRNRVEALIKRYDRGYIQNYADRFRFNTLQSRFVKLTELWDRGQRAREEGRPTQFTGRSQPRPPAAPAKRQAPDEFSVSITDPAREIEHVKDLHARLVEAGERAGQSTPSFAKFAQLVRVQVHKLQQNSPGTVTFHVAVKDGKLSFTAKAGRASNPRPPTEEKDD